MVDVTKQASLWHSDEGIFVRLSAKLLLQGRVSDQRVGILVRLVLVENDVLAVGRTTPSGVSNTCTR
jgi:hypothetical protein